MSNNNREINSGLDSLFGRVKKRVVAFKARRAKSLDAKLNRKMVKTDGKIARKMTKATAKVALKNNRVTSRFTKRANNQTRRVTNRLQRSQPTISEPIEETYTAPVYDEPQEPIYDEPVEEEPLTDEIFEEEEPYSEEEEEIESFLGIEPLKAWKERRKEKTAAKSQLLRDKGEAKKLNAKAALELAKKGIQSKVGLGLKVESKGEDDGKIMGMEKKTFYMIIAAVLILVSVAAYFLMRKKTA